MAVDRLYSVARRDPLDQRSPVEFIDEINALGRPSSQGGLAYASQPVPGIERDLEVLHDLACGVAVLRMTDYEAEMLGEHFRDLEIAPEAWLPLANNWPYGPELEEGSASNPWRPSFVIRNVRGEPIENARIVASVAGLDVAVTARTDRDGRAVLRVPRNSARFYIRPAHSYWDVDLGVLEHRQFFEPNEIVLESLSFEPGMQWDVRMSGAADLPEAPRSDAPVVVALIDTGVADHRNLAPLAIRKNYVDGEPSQRANVDLRGHGTAMAGIIVGGTDPMGMRGYAPDAELRLYRAVPLVGGASDIDVARAVTDAVLEGADIVCIPLSIAADRAQPVALREALRFAGQHGAVCCLPTGNDATSIGWPAAYNFAHCLSVGAFGRSDAVPANTTHAQAVSEYPTSAGYFFAAFSNRGTLSTRVDVIAPGVATITTVPGGYAAVSGTSFAAAHVAGLAAAVLARIPRLREAPPDLRGIQVTQRLRSMATAFGWGAEREGRGRIGLQTSPSAA